MKKKYKLKDNYFLEIEQSELCENPNLHYEAVIMAFNHRQFYVMPEGFDPISIAEYLNFDGEEGERDDSYDNYYIFIVDAYIHSGVSLSLRPITEDRKRDWDVSSGFLLIDKTIIQDKTDEEYLKIGEEAIKRWNDYLEGKTLDFYLYKLHPYKKQYLDEEELHVDLLDRMDDIHFDKELLTIEEVTPVPGTYDYLTDSCDYGFYEHLTDEVKEELKNLM